MANLVGATAQMMNHATTLANLGNANPFTAVTSILLSRFVSGLVYSNTTTVTETKESVPVQSKIDVGVLTINNQRTHLEGIWNIDKATINTGKFTTAAPKHTMESHSETIGFSVSFSPASLFAAAFIPGAYLALAALPTVGVIENDASIRSMHMVPAQLIC